MAGANGPQRLPTIPHLVHDQAREIKLRRFSCIGALQRDHVAGPHQLASSPEPLLRPRRLHRHVVGVNPDRRARCAGYPPPPPAYCRCPIRSAAPASPHASRLRTTHSRSTPQPSAISSPNRPSPITHTRSAGVIRTCTSRLQRRSRRLRKDGSAHLAVRPARRGGSPAGSSHNRQKPRHAPTMPNVPPALAVLCQPAPAQVTASAAS